MQCALFVLDRELRSSSIRGMFWVYLGVMFMTAMGGVALGLVISSLVADPKTAANIVPLVLIPQIIMGGALIKYEDMNRNLGLFTRSRAGSRENPNPEKNKKMDSKLKVPFVCQFIAMRWSYEELVVAQAKLNPLTRRQERVNARDRSKLVAEREDARRRRSGCNELKEVARGSLRPGGEFREGTSMAI